MLTTKLAITLSTIACTMLSNQRLTTTTGQAKYAQLNAMMQASFATIQSLTINNARTLPISASSIASSKNLTTTTLILGTIAMIGTTVTGTTTPIGTTTAIMIGIIVTGTTEATTGTTATMTGTTVIITTSPTTQMAHTGD